ncbi:MULTISPECIES: hypothetical protein [Mesorhizobium]|uniref:hypothetical protein n=1 Tax=Mesorhizobium TaxID=68287 RepID=UPI000B162248|nr:MULTISPECIES: hypothetical protein [Mesorhizobium]
MLSNVKHATSGEQTRRFPTICMNMLRNFQSRLTWPAALPRPYMATTMQASVNGASLAAASSRDIEALRAAITKPWSANPVEGQINRLTIKRQMYGRAAYPRLLAAA